MTAPEGAWAGPVRIDALSQIVAGDPSGSQRGDAIGCDAGRKVAPVAASVPTAAISRNIVRVLSIKAMVASALRVGSATPLLRRPAGGHLSCRE